MKQKIVIVPDPILRQKSKPVNAIDKKILALIQDMKDTMDSKGAGISAPQIGKSLRMCVVNSRKNKEMIVFINPEIIYRAKLAPIDKNTYYEGCLSVPNVWGLVRRPSCVKVRYLTPENKVVIRRFTGLLNTTIQHEIDHLDGILFIDRVLSQKGKLYQIEKDKEGKEEMVEIKLT